MAAQYDAGSIEATLTVNQDPMDEGLRHAQERVRQFEDEPHEADLDLRLRDTEANAEIDEVRRRLNELSDDGGFSLRPHVDTEEARAEVDALRARLAELHDRDVTVRVNTEESTSQVRELGNEIDRAAGDSGSGGSSSDSGHGGVLGLISKFTLLGGLAGGVIPPLVGEAAGLGGAFGIAGIGALAFGKIASTQFKAMQTDTAAVTKAQQELTQATTNQQRIKAINDLAAANAKLKGPEGEAAKGMESMTAAYGKLKSATSTNVYGVLAQGMNMITQLLPKLTPLINSSAGAVSASIGTISHALQGSGFQHFLDFLSKNVAPVMSSLTGSFVNFSRGFAQGMEHSMSVTHVFLDQINQLSSGFAHLTGSPAFAHFMNELAGDMKLLTPVARDLFDTLGHLLQALQPMVAPVLTFLDALIKGIDTIVQGGLGTFLKALGTAFGDLAPILPPLAKVLSDIFAAIAPVLPLLGQLAATILPPLLKMFDMIVKALAPLITALVQGLQPVIPIIAHALQILMQALGPFLQALGPVFEQILKAIMPILPMLANLFVIWATAMASVMRALTPLIQLISSILIPVLRVVVDVIGPVISIIGDLIRWLSDLEVVVLKLVTGALSWLVHVGGEIVHGLWSGLVDAWHAVASWFGSMGSMIGHFFASAGAWLVNAGKNVIEGAWHGIQTAWRAVANFFGNIGSAIGHWFAGAVGWLLNAGKNVISGLWNGVKNVWNSVTGWFGGIARWVKNFGGDAIHWLENLGKNIIQGLWNGLKSLWGDVTGWVSDAAHGIGHVFSNVMSIFSPSRVMHGIGVNIMKGLHLGMIDGFAPVPGTLNEQANKIKNAFGGAGGLSANVRVNSAATLQAEATKAQTTKLVDLHASIERLHNTIKNLPEGVGDKVGSVVGKEFDKTQTKAANMRIVAQRQGGS